jgi:hypothetical protein
LEPIDRGSFHGRPGAADQSAELCDAYADWLRRWDRVPDRPWALFVTLTFLERIHPEQAARRFGRFLDGCVRGGRPVRWARATELQARGAIHYHALLPDVSGASPFDLVRLWKRVGGGSADVRDYDASRGAAWYLAKTVARGGEIDFGGFDD